VLDGRIWALGGRWQGRGELGSVEIYEPAADRWISGPSLNTARAGFAAVPFNGSLYVLGGEILTGKNQALTSMEVLDPAGGKWEFGPNLPLPLHGVPVISVGETLYVIGGADKPGAISNQGLVYAYRP